MQPNSSAHRVNTSDLASVVNAPLNYLEAADEAPHIHIYPPSSGRPTVRPAAMRQTVPIRDMRAEPGELRLDTCGFELRTAAAAFGDYYDEAAVRARYYPEVEAAMLSLTGAHTVVVFDHNVRSSARAARSEPGVRLPAEQVHNDYTERSGPKRKREILEAAGLADLMDRHVAFINLWRPIIGPVRDNPLAVCDARSVLPADFVVTEIRHFGEDDLQVPRHVGEIYSVIYQPAHRWFYVSEMQPEEVLLLKCYDSRIDGRARFMPHTGFQNPACPSDFVPRESIEARTLVVFDERC